MASPPNNNNRASILKVLDSMRNTEIDLVTFMDGIMSSNESWLKNIAARFLEQGGFLVVLKFMLRHLGFEGKAKHSTRCLTAVTQALGSEIWAVISEILEQEIIMYCKSPGAGKTAGTMTPETIEEFSLTGMRKNFDYYCPRFSQIMTVICPDSKGGIAEENVASQPPTNEPENEVVDEQMAPEPESVQCANMNFISTKKRRLVHKAEVPASKKRKVRDKSLIGTVCLGVLAFGHSRNANLLQMIMGYYLQGYSVAKEVISVLNRLGLTVAYNTVCESMNTMAASNWGNIQRRIQEGEAFGCAIDNCVIGDNKGEQSVLNRKETLQYTAGFLWFLNLPGGKISKRTGSILGNTPVEGIAGGAASVSGNIAEEMIAGGTSVVSVGGFAGTQSSTAGGSVSLIAEGALRACGNDTVPEIAAPEIEVGSAGKGVDRKILFRDIPDYDGIDSLWALSMGELTEYIPSRAVFHLSEVLWEFMPEIVVKMNDIRPRPKIQDGYQIPLHKSEVHGMKTQPFDEATIPGISDILDASLEELGINKYEAMDRGWLVAGDLFTLIKIEALQNVRVRDFRYNRHDYVIKLPGAFHLEMAAEDALFRYVVNSPG